MGVGGKTTIGYGYFKLKKDSEDSPILPSSIDSKQTQTITTSSTASISPPKDLDWQRAKVSKDCRTILPLENPNMKLTIHKDYILPKGWTPASKSEVEFAVEELPNGKQRIWVKKLYHPT